MRLGLFLLVVAGCSDNGAHLTFVAPNGPSNAASFRIVLATPNEIPQVHNQRISADGMGLHTVVYYKQRTIAGGTDEMDVTVDGMTVRIAPDSSVPETSFVPFVLMYDANQNIVGVGTYRPEASVMPAPILVIADEIDKYKLSIEPVVQVDDMAPVASGQAQIVTCLRDDQSTFTSGIVWRPASGGEIRLLFPADVDSTDATKRALDLDCDEHVVTVESSSPDCDDTRGWFHRDAREMCDGHDTNCDGLQSLAVACTPSTGSTVCGDPVTNAGIALCNDTGEGTPGVCQSDPTCLCNNGLAGCRKCYVRFEPTQTNGSIIPCQPGVGLFNMPDQCTDAAKCTVEVVGYSGGWKVEIANQTSTSFGYKATDVGHTMQIKARRPEGAGVMIMGMAGASTGSVDLAIISAGGTATYLGIDLRLKYAINTCGTAMPYQMSCQ